MMGSVDKKFELLIHAVQAKNTSNVAVKMINIIKKCPPLVGVFLHDEGPASAIVNKNFAKT